MIGSMPLALWIKGNIKTSRDFAEVLSWRDVRERRDWLDGEGSIFPELRVAQFSPVSLVPPAIYGINGAYAYRSYCHGADESYRR